jgi:hypothetical protein
LRYNNGSDDHGGDNRDKPEIDEQIVLEHASLLDFSREAANEGVKHDVP